MPISAAVIGDCFVGKTALINTLLSAWKQEETPTQELPESERGIPGVHQYVTSPVKLNREDGTCTFEFYDTKGFSCSLVGSRLLNVVED